MHEDFDFCWSCGEMIDDPDNWSGLCFDCAVEYGEEVGDGASD